MRKINMTIFAVVFVTLMIALPMTLQSAAALGSSGTSYSRDTYVNTGGASFPRFNDCEHTHLNYPDNMMVGLGVYTHYDTNVIYPAYNYGNWWFSTQAGWSSSTVSSMPPMACIFDLDFGLGTAYRSTYYDYSSGTWTYRYLYDGSWADIGHYCSVVSFQSAGSIGDRASVEGMTQGAFYYNNNPGTVYYYYAQTQFPLGHSVPPGIQSYAFLTAHAYSQYGDW
jgi:hypothetical protein